MTKLTLISLVGFFAFMASMQINAEELYICPVDQVYKTGAGRSIDVEGGTIKFTINGEDIVITNPSVSGFGSIPLKIIQRNGNQIKAKSRTVIFTYKVVSREYVVHTGIAPMKFDVDVGHRGGQMRIAGVCNPQ
tara:strand:+ start:86 stop:487 length:402 start_codon:yes stop_codon:yes gene_type:complete